MFQGNATWWCRPCDVTARGAYYSHPRCCRCGAEMACMGAKWAPGRKGTRMRAWDDRRARRAAQKRHMFRPSPYHLRPTF
jgi:hypothetical protein